MKNTQQGFIVPLLLIIIAFLLVGGGAYIYTQKKEASPAVSGNVELPQATSTEQTTTVTTQTTTASSITVLSPNGGEVWPIGSTQTIRWANNGFSNGVVYFELIDSRYNASSEDNQTHFTIANAVPNTGSYTWTIPSSSIGASGAITPGSQYKIRIGAYKTTSAGILDYDNLVQGDVSDATFSIVVAPKTISATVPNIKSAQISQSIDGPMILYVYGTGFDSSFRVYVNEVNGLSNVLMPVSQYASENGSNGTSITVVIPNNMDTTKQYNVYISNGNTISNIVTTPFHG